MDQAEAKAGLNDESLRQARKATNDAEDYYKNVKDAQDQAVSAADSAYTNAVAYEADVQSYYDQIVSDKGVRGQRGESSEDDAHRSD